MIYQKLIFQKVRSLLVDSERNQCLQMELWHMEFYIFLCIETVVKGELIETIGTGRKVPGHVKRKIKNPSTPWPKSNTFSGIFTQLY